jgi:hypothetical protein
MSKLVKKRYDLFITSANSTKKETFILDKDISFVKGLLFTSDKDELLYYRGQAKVGINGEEYFPENYESKLLMTGINVSPNQRYYLLENVKAGNGQIEVHYTDTNDGRTTFTPYRVSLYVECIKEVIS